MRHIYLNNIERNAFTGGPPIIAHHNGLEFGYNCGLTYLDEIFDAQVVSYLPQSPVQTKSGVPEVD
jgi:hypothetical protein